MKRILFGMAALATLALGGCNEAERLASEVEGSWSSTPQIIVNDVGSQSSMVENVTFVRDSTTAGGQVIFTGLISTTGALSGSDAVVQPFEIAASAKSTVSGKWTAIDDDEIILSLDLQSMSVDVDPSALVISNNVLSGNTESNPEALKPQMAAMVKAALQRTLSARYASMTELYDVDVKNKGAVLNFEVGKTDYVYTSQNPAK